MIMLAVLAWGFLGFCVGYTITSLFLTFHQFKTTRTGPR